MFAPTVEPLLVTFSSDADLTVDANVITNNRLNWIVTQGSGLDSGREHIESKFMVCLIEFQKQKL